jgi:hypothetical protein
MGFKTIHAHNPEQIIRDVRGCVTEYLEVFAPLCSAIMLLVSKSCHGAFSSPSKEIL